MNQYKKPIRHGDVDLIPIESLPDKVTLKKDNLVMHGENGHSHILVNGQLLIMKDRKFIKSGTDTHLIHEEHRKTVIPQGIFEVMQEVEFDPFTATLNRVRD